MIDLLVQTFRSPRIESTTHLVLMLAIARRCGDEKGVCFAKQSTLAADTRLHQKTVGKAIGELEALGLIKRIKGGVDDSGRRSTDHLYVCLDAVTLPRTGPDAEGSPALPPGSPALPSQGASDSPSRESGTPHKETPEETNEEADARSARERAQVEAEGVDVHGAVEVIWAGAGKWGRRRTKKSQVERALVAALVRRPRGVSADDHLRRILTGYRAYLASEDARRSAGKFEKGIHRLLEGDVWATYLDDEPARADRGERQPLDPALGSVDNPGPALQAYWMETDKQGLPWHSERGPRPGLPGCRVDPDLQREFGYEPYPDQGDADASAFL